MSVIHEWLNVLLPGAASHGNAAAAAAGIPWNEPEVTREQRIQSDWLHVGLMI